MLLLHSGFHTSCQYGYSPSHAAVWLPDSCLYQQLLVILKSQLTVVTQVSRRNVFIGGVKHYTVMVKSLHLLVKNMSIIAVLSSNDFHSSHFSVIGYMSQQVIDCFLPDHDSDTTVPWSIYKQLFAQLIFGPVTALKWLQVTDYWLFTPDQCWAP